VKNTPIKMKKAAVEETMHSASGFPGSLWFVLGAAAEVKNLLFGRDR
jgi:hypothetical protein